MTPNTPTPPKTPINANVKRIAKTASVIVGILLLLAVLIGVLNALTGKQNSPLGWNDYRYDDERFEMGEGTIPSQSITQIEIDWLDGSVLILPCQDAYPSLVEQTDDATELPDSARVRWCVDNGTLTVKYRASSWFFGFGNQNRNKTLTLRIPEAMLSQITNLDVTTTSGNIVLDNVDVAEFDAETDTGNIRVLNSEFEALSLENASGQTELSCTVRGRMELDLTNGNASLNLPACPQSLDLESKHANVTLTLPVDASFRLDWETDSGNLSSDFPYTVSGSQYTVGNGDAHFTIETASGDLLLSRQAQ